MTVRRALLVSLAAVLLAGCGSIGDVRLSTADHPERDACFLSYGGGDFIEHATYGVAVKNRNGIYALE